MRTPGAKTTVPVFLGKRLKIFGNPVQQQQEWGREICLPGIENNPIPMSGMLFRLKIALHIPESNVTSRVRLILLHYFEEFERKGARLGQHSGPSEVLV
eukprot:sb/3478701/